MNDKKYEELNKCLCCDSQDLIEVIDLGMHPLANALLKDIDQEEEFFPLILNRCKKCNHLQLSISINSELMFKDYVYVSGIGTTAQEFFEWFADWSSFYYSRLYPYPKNVFDIGSNNGTQLNYFKKLGIETFGVDPAENLYKESSKEHSIYCNFFTKEFTKELNGKTFDIIVAQNVFAHNPNPYDFLCGIKEIMHDDSLAFIQCSQIDMIKNNEYDTSYFEHLSFFNINSMNELCNRVNVKLFDVIKHPIHGNSYIFVIHKNIGRPNIIEKYINEEKFLSYDETYIIFNNNCQKNIKDLQKLIKEYNELGYHIIGFGAAAKGNTVLNTTKIKLDFIIDDTPLKQNLYAPGSRLKIYSIDILEKYSNVEKIVFIPLAWNFYDEIYNRIKQYRKNYNDVFIKYFPKISINY